MANYISTQSGNWSSADTWGGSGYPNTSGDTATISTGHTVIYNVDSAVILGNITIDGLLTFKPDANTKLVVGGGPISITVNSGGELRLGEAANPIGGGYTAELYWSNASDGSGGLTINDGGKLTIAGDPAVYGNDDDTRLAMDWTSGSMFTTVDDMSAKWQADQVILIHKFYRLTAINTWTTDTFPATIQSISGTAITINQAHPGGTFAAGGEVINVSRNVKIGKFIAGTEPLPINNAGNLVTYTNRPRLYNKNTVAGNIFVKDALMTAYYRVYMDDAGSVPGAASFENCVFRHCYEGFYDCKYIDIIKGTMYGTVSRCYSNAKKIEASVRLIANSNIFQSCTDIMNTGNIYSNRFIGNSSIEINNVISGNIYSNVYCFNATNGYIISGNIFYNLYCLGTPSGCLTTGIVTGRLGYDSNNISRPNTYDITFAQGPESLVLRNTQVGSLNVLGRNTPGSLGRVKFEHYNCIVDDHRVMDCCGDIIKTRGDGLDDSPLARSGGAADVMEVVPLSCCDAANPLKILTHRFWAAAGAAKTYRYYLQSTFPAPLTASEVRLTARFLDEAGGGHQGEVHADETVAPRVHQGDWSQCTEVTVHPVQEGWVDLTLSLGKYACAAKLWVDPKVVVI